MFKNIRVVLVRTFHSGNIGSAARAMKTMGLSDLCLVEPLDFNTPKGRDEALKMAVSADDLINKLSSFNSLYEAVQDCTVVIASTARSRGFDLPVLSPEDSAKMLYQSSTVNNEKVALVFGPERTGLSNEDLSLAKYRVTIPTNPNYSSLNLASAVQTIAYEILKQHNSFSENKSANQLIDHRTLPDTKSMEEFYAYLENSLTETGFIIKNHPGDVMKKLKMIISRSQVDSKELNILRGMFSSFQRKK